jgi:hypothetical protein
MRVGMTTTASSAESSPAIKLSGKTIVSVLRDCGAPLFVWGVWALMLLTALAFVGTYGANVPFWDDFNYVVALTGEQPITLTWLWSPSSGHRILLPRLILLGLYRLSADFRAAMFFNVLALGALAFAMIWIAKRLRGRMSYADAFFPLALLHAGHCTNLLFSIQVAYILPTVLAGTMLLFIASGKAHEQLRMAVLAGICLVLLPLCSAIGLVLVPPLALWLTYVGLCHWRSGQTHARRNGLVILALAFLALLLVAIYLRGLPVYTYKVEGPRPLAILKATVLILCQGFGPAFALPLEPLLGWNPALLVMGLGVVALLLLSTVPLIRTFLTQRVERPRVLGLLMFLAAMVCLGLSVGYGRPGVYFGLVGRYAMLSVPALCCVYLIWSLHGSPAIGPPMRTGLLAYMSILTLFNLHYGVIRAKYHKLIMSSFSRDLDAGVPNFMLAGRYAPALAWGSDVLRLNLVELHRAGLNGFRSLRADPAFREVPLPLASAELHGMTLEHGAVRGGAGADSSLVLTLPATTFVGGIRIKYCHSAPGAEVPEPFEFAWKNDRQPSFTEARSRFTTYYLTVPDSCHAPAEESAGIWLGTSLNQVRIRPDPERRPGSFRILEVVLLVPASEEFAVPGRGDWYDGTLVSPRAAVFNEAYILRVRYRETLAAFFDDVRVMLFPRRGTTPAGSSSAEQRRTSGSRRVDPGQIHVRLESDLRRPTGVGPTANTASGSPPARSPRSPRSRRWRSPHRAA